MDINHFLHQVRSIQHIRISRFLNYNIIKIFGLWVLVELLRLLIASLVVLALLLPSPLMAQGSAGSPFFSGERLTYRVKWMFIRLGTIEITQQIPESPGTQVHALSMRVQSAKGLPFFTLDFEHRTCLSVSPLRMHEETIRTYTEPHSVTHYCRQAHALVMTDSVSGQLTRYEVIQTDTCCYDAISLLMFVRLCAASDLTVQLPTVNDFALGTTELHCCDGLQDVEAPAFDHPVPCHVFHGNARWVGSSFAGMSGDFRGWVSNDDAHLPIRAEVKIIVGSITIELESYARPGWSPLIDSSIVQGGVR